MFQMRLWIKQKLLSPQQCLVDQRDLIISTAMPCGSERSYYLHSNALSLEFYNKNYKNNIDFYC